ncbi:MAG: nicotinate-nucleotide adenylyltransferase [Nitriliruptoraceae bacterium]
MKRVGLLGGSFDPPHLGHLIVAECARVELQLDEVRLLVAGDPWMKRTVAPAAARVALTHHAVADSDGLVCDDREVSRDGPTYTVDTLEELTTSSPDTEWFFIVGDDAAADLERWHRHEDLLSLATFVVVRRNGALASGPAAAMQGLDVPPIGISSSDVRRRYADGRATRHLVPLAVDDEIRRRDLYGASGD